MTASLNVKPAKLPWPRALQTLIIAAWSLGGAWFLSYHLPRYPEAAILIIAVVACPLIWVSFILSFRPAVSILLSILLLGSTTFCSVQLYQVENPMPPSATGTASEDARLFINVSTQFADSSDDAWLPFQLTPDATKVSVAVTIVNLSSVRNLEKATVTLRVVPESGGMVRIVAKVDAPGYYSMTRDAFLQAKDPRSAELQFDVSASVKFGVSEISPSSTPNSTVDSIDLSPVEDDSLIVISVPSVPESYEATTDNRAWLVIPAVFKYKA
ncbi:hypothetical protein [Plantibacter sp. Leaf314]|uniref:hypothetical protein n=1 Tax=Plantibacter sp. Leaf314 TaxID=1736333 RepID=UPI000B271BCF|nr:hypothetical protein [Plantibacter sp. Leaf314]